MLCTGALGPLPFLWKASIPRPLPHLAGLATLSSRLISPSTAPQPTAPLWFPGTSLSHSSLLSHPPWPSPVGKREEFPGRKELSHWAAHLVSDLDTQLEGAGRKRSPPPQTLLCPRLLPTVWRQAGRCLWRGSNSLRQAASPTRLGPLRMGLPLVFRKAWEVGPIVSIVQVRLPRQSGLLKSTSFFWRAGLWVCPLPSGYARGSGVQGTQRQ